MRKDEMPLFHRVLNKLRIIFGILFFIFIFLKSNPNLYYFSGGIFLLIIAGLLRIWANGCIEKIETLTQSGPYLLCRHPLYLGNFLIGVAYCLISGIWYSFFLLIILFLIFYYPLILEEEKFLKDKFAEEYLNYQRKVPCFIPKFFGKKELKEFKKFSWNLAKKNREPSQFFFNLLLGIIFGVKFFLK
jgi:protein-S-isoprenylcysteine O-methyltransferase Ste14